MAAAEIARSAPAARFAGTARLAGFELEFRRRSVRWGGGAADIVASPGGEVWGVLYELGSEELAALDVREGAGVAYRRVRVEVEAGGERVSAETYEVIEKEPVEVPPTPAYAALLLGAARERGLPAAYVAALEGRVEGLGRTAAG